MRNLYMLAEDAENPMIETPPPLLAPVPSDSEYMKAPVLKPMIIPVQSSPEPLPGVEPPPPSPPSPPAEKKVFLVPWAQTGTPWEAAIPFEQRVRRILLPYDNPIGPDSVSWPHAGLTVAYWYLLYRIIRKLL